MNDQDRPAGGGVPGDGAPLPGRPDPRTIDLEQLADKVYRLMRDELRLARARGERAPRRGR